jgi:hypothetical protein
MSKSAGFPVGTAGVGLLEDNLAVLVRLPMLLYQVRHVNVHDV